MLPYDVRKHEDMRNINLTTMGFMLIFIVTTLVFVGCGQSDPKREAAEAEAKVAKEADERFTLVSSQMVDYRRIYVVKDKETEIEYVMVTYGESVVFRPLLKKEER